MRVGMGVGVICEGGMRIGVICESGYEGRCEM